MKKTVSIIIWTIFWLAAESTVLNDILPWNLQFDLIFLSVVAITFAETANEGLALVLLIGLIADAVSPAPFGIMTAVYTAAYIAIRMALSTIYLHSVIARWTWTFIASVVAIWVKAMLMALTYKNQSFITLSLWSFIPQSIINALLAFLVFPLFTWCLELSPEKIFRQKDLVLK